MDLHKNSLGLGDRPALILVDMINGFTDPECPLGSHCPDVVAANQQLLAAFRAANLPVFFTTVVFHNESQARVFRDKINDLDLLTPESKWVQVDQRLTPTADEAVIEKRWASGFFQTDLAQQLLAVAADSIVVTGLTTSGCVRATVVDGLQHNYKVTVAREAVGDRNSDAHQANLFDMNAKYADVVSVEHIINKISN
ncbi:isochorismatase family protein [Thalassotalea sp. HSM 43]|uniref:isochorismatase family protein n=1 Tax=Thalassotalea sp. HSM 43 TaxID=2552945 RepID=UPI00107FD82B|nr:isochorismatase family protein [Thalassotalea sp. HSM 43]QBY04520.1 isochorismatase family protein [Thalassotalea sp. HSM 43]